MRRKRLSALFMFDVGSILNTVSDGDIVHEHTALIPDLPGEDPEKEILDFILELESAEFETARTEDATYAWSSTSGIRLEILTKSFPPHEAWSLRLKEDFELLFDTFEIDPGFSRIEGRDITRSDFRSAMWTHLETGEIVQILWRRKQIFPDLFQPEGPEPSEESETAHESATV